MKAYAPRSPCSCSTGFHPHRRKRAPNVSPRDWKLRLENAAAGADAVAAEVVAHPTSVRAAGAAAVVWVEEAALVVLFPEREVREALSKGCARKGRRKWTRRRGRKANRRRRRGSR